VKVVLNEATGAVVAGLNQRRGTISNTEVRQDEFTVTAEVALSEMFGYSAQLRGATQGKGLIHGLCALLNVLIRS
jgi:elongation factor G